MKKKARPTPISDTAEEKMEHLLFAAILNGDRLPTTIEQVKYADEHVYCKMDVQFPAELADPFAALDNGRAISEEIETLKKASTASARADLARAAREGGEITSDIEKRMEAARISARLKKSNGKK